MTHMSINQQMMNDNLNFIARAKRMNFHFMKCVTLFFENMNSIEDAIT